MSKEKQIEEMANDIAAMCPDLVNSGCGDLSCVACLAKGLEQMGYRKQSEGEWILTGTFKSTFPLPVAYLHISCSVCGWKPPKYSDDYKEYNFCPNCGAKMKGGAE